MVNLNLRYLALIVAVATGFATGLGMKTASAADLGGDCCADLEERVAELEATTVRKGNKKVSVTLTGWVAEQVVYWDDGVEQNTYITGLGTAFASNFHITGEARNFTWVEVGIHNVGRSRRLRCLHDEPVYRLRGYGDQRYQGPSGT